MARYTLEHTDRSVTFTVSEIAPPKTVWFTVRYDDANDKSLVIHESRNATSATLTETFEVPRGHKYATNVDFGDGVYLGLQTFDTISGRPDDWTWSGIIASGSAYENLTAEAWNRFEDRIDEFRKYKGLTAYGFTRAVSGMTLLVTLFSEAEAAIGGIPGHGTVPTGRELAMTYFNGLANALNAVS